MTKTTPARQQQAEDAFRLKFAADGVGFTVEEMRDRIGAGSFTKVGQRVRELIEECKAAADVQTVLPDALKAQVATALGAAYRDLTRTADARLIAFKAENEQKFEKLAEEKTRLYARLDEEIDEKDALKAQFAPLKSAHEDAIAREHDLQVKIAGLEAAIGRLESQLMGEEKVQNVLNSILRATGTSLAEAENAPAAAGKRRIAKAKA